MAATTIQEFLIKFGFLTDQASAKRFHDTMNTGVQQIKSFRLELVALAAGIEETVRRTTRQFDQMFFSARNLNVPAKALADMSYGLKQIHVDAGAALAPIAEMLKKPELKMILEGRTGGAPINDAVEGLKRLTETYRDLISGPMGEASQAARQFRDQFSEMGIDFAGVIGPAAKSWDIVLKGIESNQKIARAFHLNWADAEKAAQQANQSWNDLVRTLEVGIGKLVTDNLPALQDGLNAIAEWLQSKEVKDGINNVIGSITAFFKDKSNREALIADLRTVGKVLGVVWDILVDIKDAFVWLCKKVGPEWATGIAAALLIIGPTIVSSITAALMGIAWEALFGGAVVAAGVIGAAAGPVLMAALLAAAAAYALRASGTNDDPKTKAHEKDLAERARRAAGVTTHQISPTDAKRILEGPQSRDLSFNEIQRLRDIAAGKPGTREYGETEKPPPETTQQKATDKAAGYQHGGIVRANLHEGEMVLPRNISLGLQQLFARGPAYQHQGFGDEGEEWGTRFAEMFNRWMGGDTAFRPVVDFAEAAMEKLRNLFLDFFPELTGKPGEGGAAGGASGGTSGPPGATPDGPPGAPSTPDSEAGNLSQKALELISKSEGTFHSGSIDYNEIYGSKHADLANMTLTQVMEMQKGMIASMGHSPVGAFQIVRKTLEGLVKELKLDPNAVKMTPEVQRQLATQLYKESAAHLVTQWNNPTSRSGELQRQFELLKKSNEVFSKGPGMMGPVGTPGGPGYNNPNVDASAARGVETRMTEAMVQAYKETLPPGWSAKVTSGREGRGGGWHGQGKAEDWQVYDEKGHPIANKAGTGPDAAPYRAAYTHALAYLIEKYGPEEAKKLGSGLYFGTQRPSGGPRDQMHVDYGGPPGPRSGIRASAGFGDPWEPYREALKLVEQRKGAPQSAPTPTTTAAQPAAPKPATTVAAPAAPKPQPVAPQPATTAATPRDRTGPLVEGGTTYPEGVMSPSELERWHQQQAAQRAKAPQPAHTAAAAGELPDNFNSLTQQQQNETYNRIKGRSLFPPGTKFNSNGFAISPDLGRDLPGQHTDAAHAAKQLSSAAQAHASHMAQVAKGHAATMKVAALHRPGGKTEIDGSHTVIIHIHGNADKHTVAQIADAQKSQSASHMRNLRPIVA